MELWHGCVGDGRRAEYEGKSGGSKNHVGPIDREAVLPTMLFKQMLMAILCMLTIYKLNEAFFVVN